MIQTTKNFRAGDSTIARWLPRTLPVLLAGALQVMPLLRATLPLATQGCAPSAWSIVLKLATGAVALFGYHAISSASSLSAPAAGTVGVAYAGATTYSGGHASSVLSWQVNTNWQSSGIACAAAYPIAPGLSLTMNPTFKYLGTITGTPTQAGTFSVKITLWSGTGCTGGDNDVQYTTITIAPGAAAGPVFIASPTNQTLTAGGTAAFAAAASGSPPPGYYWKFNNAVIAGANAAAFQKSNVQLADAGIYSVFATNSTGAVSNSAALTVIVPPPNQTNKVGANITFTAIAASPEALNYRWQFKGVDIAGATNATFTTNNVQPGSAGTYSVILSNNIAATTCSATLTVTAAPPAIATAPVGTSVTAGQSAGFTVAATGTGPLGYQWQKNGTNLAGATGATYMINPVRVASAGNFTVVVTNAAGSVTSAVAVLRVTPPAQPLAALPPAPAAAAGSRFVFSFLPVVGLTNTVLTNSNGGLTGWGVLTNVPPPVTGSSITVTDTVAGPGRFYRVMVMP